MEPDDLTATSPPSTRRERLAYFFSMDGGFTRFTLWLFGTVGVLGAFLAFAVSLIDIGQRCVPRPDPVLGKTYFVEWHRHCTSGGYMNGRLEFLAHRIMPLGIL